VLILLVLKQKVPKPVDQRFLIARAVTNFCAVYCFFEATEVTSAAQANILNMTAPVFIALFSWVLGIGKRDLLGYFISFLAFIGIVLTLDLTSSEIGLESLWGLASGIFAAIAIIFLNISRRDNDIETVLFYLFIVGSVLSVAFFGADMYWPNDLEFKYLLVGSLFGIFGQFLLTYAFRYISAVEGGVIGTSRILMAVILGPILTTDPALSQLGWFGALLIFISNVVLALRKKVPEPVV
jgi:drug/metabolite transporter (DMT)-like permease